MSIGQNLIPNGSFEQLAYCPDDADMGSTPPWGSTYDNGIIYTGCAEIPGLRPPFGSVFYVSGGTYQVPRSGQTMAGFSNWTDFPNQHAEYLYVPLARPLLPGERCYLSLWVTPDETAVSYVLGTAFANAFAAGFARRESQLSPDSVAQIAPVAVAAEVIRDTARWQRVEACFTAEGGEAFLVLGDLLPRSDLEIFYTDGLETFDRTWLFVDDVELYAFDPLPADTVACRGEVSLPPSDTLLAYEVAGCATTAADCFAGVDRARVVATDERCAYRDTMAVAIVDPSRPYALDTVKCAGDDLLVGGEGVGGLPPIRWEGAVEGAPLRIDAAGTYRGTVEASCGPVDVELVAEEVDCACRPALPTAFSPNGDGVNDVLHVYEACPFPVGEYRLRLFDRWGGLVFSGEGADVAWDGFAAGRRAQAGVYSYVLEYVRELTQGAASGGERLVGEVTLVR